MVSVVIPVYNVEIYLRECVDSVLKQTYQDYEIILVDDGATDHSGDICDQYASGFNKISVIHQENGGLSAARNTGLAAARGEYVYFLDSDDYILPETLAELFECADAEKADVVFFDGSVFFDGCEEDPDVFSYVRKNRYVSSSGRKLLTKLLQNGEYRTAVPLMMFRKEYLTQHHLTFMPGLLHEDELFTYFVYFYDGRIAHCHKEFYQRRMRPGSIMTASGLLRRFKSYLKIYYELEKYYPSNEKCVECADLYMIRTSKGILGRFQTLDDKDKKACESDFKRFRKNVLLHHGFGDWKLKIKCSDGFRRYLYRVEYKLYRIFHSK